MTKILFIVFAVLITGCNDPEDITYTSLSGLWKCEEIDETSAVQIFNIDIDNVKNYENTFIISNFHNTGEEFFIRITTTDSLVNIPSQTLLNSVISGTGTSSIDFSILKLQYTLEDGGRSATFLATCYR